MLNGTNIIIERLPHALGLPSPARATEGAAGFDLHAAIPENSSVVLEPGSRAKIPTGLKLKIPSGFEGQVRPRSGLALKNGITVLNSPGTIDSDYRGEVSVVLINLGNHAFSIERSLRVAQVVFVKLPTVHITEGEVDMTVRGSHGFGSTGS